MRFGKNKRYGFEEENVQQRVRLMSKEGKVNVEQRNIPFIERFNIYYPLIELAGHKFLFLLILSYILINVIFATIYYLIGLDGINFGENEPGWWQAFFFSSHTLTNLGYGHISPQKFWINVVASSEAFIGFLLLSVATSLIYGRFTNSKAKLIFSDFMLLGPYENGVTIDIRVGNKVRSNLSNMKAKIVVSWIETNKRGILVRKYKKLPLLIDEINTFTTSWLLSHHINQESPLRGKDLESMVGLEFIVHVSAYDEAYDQHIHKKTSYLLSDLVFGASFVTMTDYLHDKTVVDIRRINDYQLIDMEDEFDKLFHNHDKKM